MNDDDTIVNFFRKLGNLMLPALGLFSILFAGSVALFGPLLLPVFITWLFHPMIPVAAEKAAIANLALFFSCVFVCYLWRDITGEFDEQPAYKTYLDGSCAGMILGAIVQMTVITAAVAVQQGAHR